MPRKGIAAVTGRRNSTSVIGNILWKFSERGSAQLVTFAVSIIIARILDPAAYGIVAIVLVFINIANVFVSSGLGSALIQKKNADTVDFSSILYFQIAVSACLYGVIFVGAPLIASYYGEGYELLTPALRVLGVRLVLAAVNSVQQAYVARHMMFRIYFYSTGVGTVISALVGVAMAYAGFGVWALVAQYLTNSIVSTVALWMLVRWRPSLVFSCERLRASLGYGWKLLCSSLVHVCYNEARALIIGKLYSPSDLAFYNRGETFPKLIINNVDSSIDVVLFSAISRVQGNVKAVKEYTRRSIRVSSYILAPLMVGLGLISEPLVRLLLTDKWVFSVPFLQVFCAAYLFYPMHTANLQAIKAIGRSDIILTLEIVKKVVGVALLVCVMWQGPFAIAIASCLTSLAWLLINGYPSRHLIGYRYREQFGDILPGIGTALMMGVPVYCLGLLKVHVLGVLFLQCAAGLLIYIALSRLFRIDSYYYLVEKARTILLHRSARPEEVAQPS